MVMKSILILITCLMILPFTVSSQIVENVDEITPFYEDLAAIRKGDKWAFINTKGDIVIDYRADLVMSQIEKEKSYPLFNNERCLIAKKIDGVNYYGYIDKSGEIVIKPEYLNATNFENGYAIVLKVSKEELGKNDLLGKNVVSYSYDEVVINTSGNDITFLIGPTHLVYKKDRLRKPPVIQSYFLSSNLVASKSKNDTHWKIFALDSSK